MTARLGSTRARALIEALPKAELHVHIEGTLEPEMAIALARRHGVRLRHDSAEARRAAYDFADLQQFLALYYEGAQVLREARDFFDLTWAYLARMAGQNVRHVEIFFDPQAHTERGVRFAEMVDGIGQALAKGERELGVTSRLIVETFARRAFGA
jgi:adenosine deaminase